MKKKYFKTNTGLVIFLCVVNSIVPVLTAIAALMDCKLVLHNEIAWAIAILAIGAVTTIAMFIFTGKKILKAGGIFACVSLLMTEANWIIFGLSNPSAMLVVAFSIVFSYMIWIRFANPLVVKVPVLIISILMLPVLTFFSFFSIAYSKSTTDVVQLVKSPDETHYVQVTNERKSDGVKHTRVDVYEADGNTNFGIFSFEQKPRNVYTTKGEDFESVQVVWISDGDLIVNGISHTVK